MESNCSFTLALDLRFQVQYDGSLAMLKIQKEKQIRIMLPSLNHAKSCRSLIQINF